LTTENDNLESNQTSLTAAIEAKTPLDDAVDTAQAAVTVAQTEMDNAISRYGDYRTR